MIIPCQRLITATLRGHIAANVQAQRDLEMTDSEYDTKQQEVDRLLNDPETPMVPDRIWALLEDLARSGPKSARGVDA